MLRTWEIAGTAHADAYTVKVGFIDNGSVPVEQLAAGYAPSTELMGQQLKQPFNFGPRTTTCCRRRSRGCTPGSAPVSAAAACAPAADRRRCAAVDHRRRERHREGRRAHAVGGSADRAHVGHRRRRNAWWPCCSDRVSRSTRTPASGCIRAARTSISNASPKNSTRRFGRATCCGPTARRSSSWPPRRTDRTQAAVNLTARSFSRVAASTNSSTLGTVSSRNFSPIMRCAVFAP